jgi:uncharacterized membrane protein
MIQKLFKIDRLETFSDGVFAIIITVMVLEFHQPEGASFADLFPLIPTFLAYLLSFIFLASYWNNHHHLLMAAKGVNAGIMWANMAFLFLMTLVPFATSWLGENFKDTAPTVLYGALLLASAFTYYVLQSLIISTLDPKSAFVKAIGADYKGRLSVAIHITAILSAFVNPAISQGLFVIAAAIWLIPDRRIEQALLKT